MTSMFHVLLSIGGFLVFLSICIEFFAPLEGGETRPLSLAITLFGVFLLAIPGFYRDRSIRNLQDEVKEQVALKPISLQAEEISSDLKDGYYVLSPKTDIKKVKETLSQNEVFVYGVFPEKDGEIHFVTIRDSKDLVDSEFKGEDVKYFEEKPERDNLFLGLRKEELAWK